MKSDPTHFIERYKLSFEDGMKKKAKETDVWSDEEFKKFINEVDNQTYKELFIMLYYTGARLSEALALTWDNIYN